jgi:hypothetical protein
MSQYQNQQPYGCDPNQQQYQPQPPRRQSWVRRHKALSVIGAGIVVFAAVSAAVGHGSTPQKVAAPAASFTPAAAATGNGCPAGMAPDANGVCNPGGVTPPSPAAPSTPSMTAAQQQAVDSAQSYLSDGQGFSYEGLLGQLTSSYGEGFAKPDAEFAIRYLHPDWDAQAVESARNYLNDGQGFSRDSLIEQLTSSYGEGFTYSQALYAVNNAGL